MKKIFLLISFGFLLSLVNPTISSACEIEFDIVKGKKEYYQTGDTIVILVEVALTHRACPIAMKKTQFKTKGLKVIKSTPWKQLSEMNWERKLMVIVTETGSNKLNLTAIRECDKDGGFGSLKLNMEK